MKLSEVTERIRCGDYTDFGVLFERTYKEIYFTALGILVDTSLAEEVLQDTYVSFLGSKAAYKKGSNIHIVLVRIAREKSYELIRSIDSMEYARGEGDDIKDGFMSLISLLEKPEDREALVYRAVLGYSRRDSARASGLSSIKSSSRYRGAMKKLRKRGYFGERGEDLRKMLRDSADEHKIHDKQTHVFRAILLAHKAETDTIDFVPQKRRRHFKYTFIAVLALLIISANFVIAGLYGFVNNKSLMPGDVEMILAEELYLMDLAAHRIGDGTSDIEIDAGSDQSIEFVYDYMRFSNLAGGKHGINAEFSKNTEEAFFSYDYKLSVSSSARPGFVTYFNEKQNVMDGNSISGVYIGNETTYHYEASWYGKDAAAVMTLTASIGAHTVFEVTGGGNNEMGELFQFSYSVKGVEKVAGIITIKVGEAPSYDVLIKEGENEINIISDLRTSLCKLTDVKGEVMELLAYYYDDYYLFVLEDGTNVKIYNGAEQSS